MKCYNLRTIEDKAVYSFSCVREIFVSWCVWFICLICVFNFFKKHRFTFYDGPPFATGLPHYGHILAGTIKDIVTRFAHQSGFHVDRRFGWDCHGLPVVCWMFSLVSSLDIVVSTSFLTFCCPDGELHIRFCFFTFTKAHFLLWYCFSHRQNSKTCFWPLFYLLGEKISFSFFMSFFLNSFMNSLPNFLNMSCSSIRISELSWDHVYTMELILK